MEYAALGCSLLCLILLVVLLLRSGGGVRREELADLEKELARLRESAAGENRVLLDLVSRQGEAASGQLNTLGENLRAAQDRQQFRSERRMEKLETDMDGFRKETGEQLAQMNAVVTEKLQEILDRKLNEAFDTVVKNMAELGKSLSESQERQQKAAAERIAALEAEFEKIRADMLAALEKVRAENVASLDRLRAENRQSLDKIDQTVNEKLQKTLDDRISRSFEQVNQRLTEVYEGLGEMKNVASGVSDLKNVLSNVKNRGILGEIQLSAILDDILAPEQYVTQYRLDPARPEMVDFAVRLPGAEEGESVFLPIDAKFPGETWAALAAAYDSGDPAQLRQRRTALEQEIKRCARSIRDKYVIPPYTTDFAILFLPFEGLYAEVVNMGLVEVLQREYKVNVTGPSTMAAMLNSLQMGFRTLAIQKKSGEVWKILEAAKKEFAAFEDVLNKTRDRLRQADDELEKLVGARTRAINRKLKTVSELDGGENAAALLEE